MREFSPYVSEQLKAYVYLLIDPRDDKPFYVGKGNGNRVFAHALDALGHEEAASDKLDRIREIHAAGQQVEHQLLRFGLTDRTAFEVEAAAIQLLGMDELTNKVEGHHVWRRGRMTTDVAISLFDAPQAPEIKERVILFRIPGSGHRRCPPRNCTRQRKAGGRLGAAAMAPTTPLPSTGESSARCIGLTAGDSDSQATGTGNTTSANPANGGASAARLPMSSRTTATPACATSSNRGESSPFKYVNC